jgi:cytochrome bd ubiquinol oxidase subunit II
MVPFWLLMALIIRGVAFEYRGKRDAVRWRRTWDALLTAGSLLAPLLIGVGLGDLLHGLPINSSQNFTGSSSAARGSLSDRAPGA